MAGLAPTTVAVTAIDSVEGARRRGFIGSPLFLIDGVDPFAVPGAAAGRMCRMYATGCRPAGVPDVEVLREALVRG